MLDLQYVIDLMDNVVALFDAEGVIYMLNKRAEQWLPFKNAELVNKNVRYLKDEGYVTGNLCIEEVIKRKEVVYQNVLYSNDRLIFYTGTPAFSHKGTFVGGVLVGRDMTQLMKLYQQQKNSDYTPQDENLIGESEGMQRVLKLIESVAPTDAPVMITGESGVGKEVVAQAIHKRSRRAGKPCLAINCGAIPAELIESELFGYEEGAFTGSKRGGKKGLLESADGGTVFLDEIGEMPKQLQSKLLRVLQEGKLTRVGGTKEISINVRYISATNLPPEKLRNEQYFRQDLYYRLCVIPIQIPPLRERGKDVCLLANYFIDRFNEKYLRNAHLTEEGCKCLAAYEWKGNVRELRNVMERLVIMSVRDEIRVHDIEFVLNLDTVLEGEGEADKLTIQGVMALDEAYKLVDRILIPRAVDLTGSYKKAADVLGVTRSTLYRKMQSSGISEE